jgi:hypothetical protein
VRAGRVRLALEPAPDPAVDRAAAVLDAARAAGPITHFAFERRSLAEVFLGTVGRPAAEATEERDEVA